MTRSVLAPVEGTIKILPSFIKEICVVCMVTLVIFEINWMVFSVWESTWHIAARLSNTFNLWYYTTNTTPSWTRFSKVSVDRNIWVTMNLFVMNPNFFLYFPFDLKWEERSFCFFLCAAWNCTSSAASPALEASDDVSVTVGTTTHELFKLKGLVHRIPYLCSTKHVRDI